jgi:hypothetical protein
MDRGPLSPAQGERRDLVEPRRHLQCGKKAKEHEGKKKRRNEETKKRGSQKEKKKRVVHGERRFDFFPLPLRGKFFSTKYFSGIKSVTVFV